MLRWDFMRGLPALEDACPCGGGGGGGAGLFFWAEWVEFKGLGFRG